MRRPAGPVKTLGGATMGTGWSVKFAAAGTSPETLRKPIEAALGRVILQMSGWNDDSTISRFHKRDIATWTPLPPELSHVLTSGIRIARETDGAYDLTLGRLADLWGFGPAGPRVSPPGDSEVASALQPSGWTKIELSSDRTSLRRHADLQLDLSGIAKGFAVDLVAMTLRAHGVTDFLAEIGGELLGRGVKPDGTPWWVDIDNPDNAFAPLMIGLHELAVATSGCERSFRSDGRSYSHTIHPRTGRPIDNGMISATVVHASAMEADAYATALMVMGAERAMEFADERGLAAIVRLTDPSSRGATEMMSAAFQAMLG